MLRSFWPLVLSLTTTVAGANVTVSVPRHPAIEQREQKIWKSFTRAAQFSDVPHISGRQPCEEIKPPQALTTPDPLLSASGVGRKVKVSFIVGTDGRVHSPLILESAGPRRDRNVLQVVRSWRYRPGMCNGVPTETEGKVEFSSR